MEQPPSFLSLSFIYILRRFWYRIAIFFHHWYVDGSYFFGRQWLRLFLSLERTFAIRITIAHFFEPLYQDYSLMGQIIGPIFRLGRLAIGSVVYLVLGIIFLFLYLLWLAIPVILLLESFLAFLFRPI
jgi:hypothetical protein